MNTHRVGLRRRADLKPAPRRLWAVPLALACAVLAGRTAAQGVGGPSGPNPNNVGGVPSRGGPNPNNVGGVPRIPPVIVPIAPPPISLPLRPIPESSYRQAPATASAPPPAPAAAKSQGHWTCEENSVSGSPGSTRCPVGKNGRREIMVVHPE